MNITIIKTHKITTSDNDLVAILDRYITDLREYSIVAITSKIVALCEGSVVQSEATEKDALIRQEADYYLPPETNQYGISLTIKNNVLIPSAGIDESNSANGYILWPKDSQATVNAVRKHLCERYNLKHLGVAITDSKTTPLRWGTTGISLAHSGFKALNDYIGKPDIFGKPLRVTRANIADGIAAATVLMMGEGSEQTPLAVVTDIPFVEFQDRDPSAEEIKGLTIDIDDDVYAEILRSVKWLKKDEM